MGCGVTYLRISYRSYNHVYLAVQPPGQSGFDVIYRVKHKRDHGKRRHQDTDADPKRSRRPLEGEQSSIRAEVL